MPKTHPCLLTIGGLDPSGGAGLPADARAAAAFGVHAVPIATAVIAQNTRGVVRVEPVLPDMAKAQLEILLNDVSPVAIKIGMVPDGAVAEVITQYLRRWRHLPIVIDTVFAPSTGPTFIGHETIAYVSEHWLPLADLVTPNIMEAEQLSGLAINDLESMAAIARNIQQRFGVKNVLIKGGHLPDVAHEAGLSQSQEFAIDILRTEESCVELKAHRVGGYEVRGTGCLLASAIAAQRGCGVPVDEAVLRAKEWLTKQIEAAKIVGGGRRVAIF